MFIKYLMYKQSVNIWKKGPEWWVSHVFLRLEHAQKAWPRSVTYFYEAPAKNMLCEWWLHISRGDVVGLYFSSPTEPAEHGSSGAVGVQHPRLTKPGPLLGPQRILSRDQKNTSEELLGQPWIVTWTWNLIICFTHEICICKHIRKYFKIQWKPSCAKNSVQGALRYFWKIWQWTISTNHWEHPNLSGVMWVLGASPKMSLSQGTRWRLPQAMFVGKDHATSSIYLPQTRKVTYL